MISDTEARKIASEWHGGQGTALYAFSSTGAIDTARADHDATAEVADLIWAIPAETDERNANELRDLERYVNANGPRGPQEGWGDLTW